MTASTGTKPTPAATTPRFTTTEVGTTTVHGALWHVKILYFPDGSAPFIPNTWATLFDAQAGTHVAMLITEQADMVPSQVLADATSWISAQYHANQ